jgi:ATP-dependent Clp protease ATP-binding subunit ClpA
MPPIFSDQANHCIEIAIKWASLRGRTEMSPLDLLAGILLEGQSTAIEMLKYANAYDAVLGYLDLSPTFKLQPPEPADMKFDDECTRLFELAVGHMQTDKKEKIETRHLLLAMTELEGSEVFAMLRSNGVDTASLRQGLRPRPAAP